MSHPKTHFCFLFLFFALPRCKVSGKGKCIYYLTSIQYSLALQWSGEPFHRGEKMVALTVKLENHVGTLCWVGSETFAAHLFYANDTIAWENQWGSIVLYCLKGMGSWRHCWYGLIFNGFKISVLPIEILHGVWNDSLCGIAERKLGNGKSRDIHVLSSRSSHCTYLFTLHRTESLWLPDQRHHWGPEPLKSAQEGVPASTLAPGPIFTNYAVGSSFCHPIAMRPAVTLWNIIHFLHSP